MKLNENTGNLSLACHELEKIEWMLAEKAEVRTLVPPSYGDLTGLNTERLILDSVGKELLEEIVRDFLGLLDSSSAVYEKNGDYATGIFSSSYCRLLDGASRQLCNTDDNRKALDSGKWLCHESCWTECCKKVIESRKEVDIECCGGIRLYGVPIFAGGEVIGAINFGYGNPPSEKETLRLIAGRFNVDADELEKLSGSYQTRPPFIIQKAKRRIVTTAKLIGEIVERKNAEKKIRHLNNVLSAIRDVNQLIVREKDKSKLIGKACEILVGTRGYTTAIIVIAENTGLPCKYAEAGLGEQFKPLARDLDKGIFPPCFEKATSDSKVFFSKNRGEICERCPIGKNCPASSMMTVRLAYNSKNYGFMSVSIPSDYSGIDEEMSLFAEVASDIAFALHDIELSDRELKYRSSLLESERRYRLLFRNLSVGFALHEIILDEKGNPLDYRFLDVNPAFESLTGLKADTLIGKTVLEALPKIEYSWIDTYGTVAQTGKPLRFEDFSRDLGKYFEVVAYSPEKGKFATIFHDITARKNQENELRLLGGLTDISPAAITIHDFDGNFIYANKKTFEMHGFTPDEFMALNLKQLDVPESGALIAERMQKLNATGEATFEVLHSRKDGSALPLNVNAKVIEWNGKKVVLSVASDITERIEMERRVLHSQKLESLGVLAGGIAHDFNNLLMVVLGNLDLALSQIPSGSEARKNIEESIKASKKAAELTKQILAYSGKGSFVIRRVDINEIAEENGQMLRTVIPKKVTLKLELKMDIPEINADPAQIQQIMMNLITNSAEAIDSKGGLVCLSTGDDDFCDEELKLSSLDNKPPAGHFVWFEVKDDGCGMEKSVLEKIFDPFFSTKFTGRGLGMSAVLGIVRAHKGAIIIDSKPGSGTTTRVLFPAQMTEPRTARKFSPKTEPKRQSPESERISGSILVVDDEKGIRKLVVLILKYYGLKAIIAENGNDALRIYKEHSDEILCVLLDLGMPELDGLGTLRELRKINPQVKVILTSGYDSESVLLKFQGEKLSGFIQKPYDMGTLHKKIMSVIIEAEKEAGSSSLAENDDVVKPCEG